MLRNLRYLSALLAHLMKHGSDEESMEKFAKQHEVGTKEEVSNRLNELRKVNKKAHRHRFNITPDLLKEIG